MFAAQRLRCLEQVLWNEAPINSINNDSITVLDCFKTAGLTNAQKSVDFRLLTLAEEMREKAVLTGNTELTLTDWLQLKGPYAQPLPPQGASIAEGGMRIVFCDRPGPKLGMSMSKASFQAIEATFDLHPATLPAFLVNGGTVSMFRGASYENKNSECVHIVIKACQKAELGNLLISLSHNTTTGWIKALICGDGVLYDRPNFDNYFGSQLEQLVTAITNSPSLWNNPMFLPVVLLQIYSERTRLRLWWTDDRLIELENHLGVTNAATANSNIERKNWPQDIDPKEITKSLHSLLTHIIYMNSCCKWMLNSSESLLKIVERLECDDRYLRYRHGLHDVRETLSYISGTSNTFDQYFRAYKERATVQVNVLFSIISQQQNILNRWDSQLSLDIARASKRDSISMTTFTFITAIFLPGTFVATLFGMTMFNWQPEDNVDSNNNDNSPGLPSQDSHNSSWSYISPKFWIFWAIAVPLTLFTLGAWLWWSRYASRKWEEHFRTEIENGVFPSSPVLTQPSYVFDLASDTWNTPKRLSMATEATMHRV